MRSCAARAFPESVASAPSIALSGGRRVYTVKVVERPVGSSDLRHAVVGRYGGGVADCVVKRCAGGPLCVYRDAFAVHAGVQGHADESRLGAQHIDVAVHDGKPGALSCGVGHVPNLYEGDQVVGLLDDGAVMVMLSTAH